MRGRVTRSHWLKPDSIPFSSLNFCKVRVHCYLWECHRQARPGPAPPPFASPSRPALRSLCLSCSLRSVVPAGWGLRTAVARVLVSPVCDIPKGNSEPELCKNLETKKGWSPASASEIWSLDRAFGFTHD